MTPKLRPNENLRPQSVFSAQPKTSPLPKPEPNTNLYTNINNIANNSNNNKNNNQGGRNIGDLPTTSPKRLSFELPETKREIALVKAETSILRNVYGDRREAIATFDFIAEAADELTLAKGTRVRLLHQVNADWWEGECDGKVGIFPSSFVEMLPVGSESTQ